jgi:hypothetical protein
MPRKSLYTEHQIQTQVVNFLRYKGYYVQRMNSGKIPIGEGRSRRLVSMSRAGTPDVMAFKASRWIVDPGGEYQQPEQIQLLFVEVKTPGNKPTPLQTEVMKELEEHGARCIVAHSIEEVEAAL